MQQLVIPLFILLIAILILIFRPLKKANVEKKLIKDLITLKTSTVNMLNKVLKTDTTKLIDFHIPDIHCNGVIDNILSPDKLVKLYHDNLNLYNKLIICGYTRTVGLLHGFALWSSTSKAKDMKSFQYFVNCITSIEWKDPTLFVDFHSPNSKIGKCIT